MLRITHIVFLIIISVPSLACTCIGTRTVREEIKHSSVVVIGKVIDSQQFSIPINFYSVNTKSQYHLVRYKILVQKVFKGKTKKSIIEIITGSGNGGDCGFQFRIDSTYIIYAVYQKRYFAKGDNVEQFLYTDACTRTKYNNADELFEIDKNRNRKWWRTRPFALGLHRPIAILARGLQPRVPGLKLICN